MNDGYRVPEGLSEFLELPLYMVVAIWGYKNNRLLTTKDVSRVFFLSHQQSSDVINYIYKEGKKHIKSQKMILFCTANGVKAKTRALKILNIAALSSQEELCKLKVKPKPKSQVKLKPKQPSLKLSSCVLLQEKRENTKAIRQWMCSRRVGEDCSSIKKYLQRVRE
ncbi:TPA: hypothetical protein JZG67_004843 [Escherichia coli]|nr:hypothetical protein [Escherichia coli]